MQLAPLVDRFRGPLTGFFAGRGISAQGASELAQDTIAEAFCARDRFTGDPTDHQQVGAWMRGIALNLLRAERRRAGHAARLHTAPLTTSIADPNPSEPAATAEMSETSARIRAHIQELPPRWRTVIYMHYLEGSGVAEISGLLGIGPRAVEGRLRRARQALREVMLRSEEVDPHHDEVTR